MKYLLSEQNTNRLKFRLLKNEDFNTWLSFFETPGAARFLAMNDLTSPYEQCKSWFEKIFERYDKDQGGMNALVNKDTNELIGQAGLLIQTVDDVEELEIGYSILPKHWNNGYATEAAIKCRNYAFENNFSDSLISIIHVDNIRSEKVARNNDMHIDKKTKWRKMPVNIFRISKNQFQKKLQ